MLAALRSFVSRRRTALSVIGAAAVAGVLAGVLAGKRGDFSTALQAAPLWLLGIAALL
jgi:hypothetical protein